MTFLINFLRVFSSDFKRSIFSRRFLFGVGFGLLMLYQPAYPFGFFEGVHFPGNTLFNAILDTLGLGAFIMCCAVLCALPYGDVHAWEVDSGEFPYIISRVGTTTYVLSKIIAVAVSGGLVLCLSFLIFCSVQAFVFVPAKVPTEEWSAAWLEAWALFRYGACWSLCALSMSAWLANPLVALAIPFCLTRFLWLMSGYLDLNILDPTMTIHIGTTIKLTFWQTVIQQSGLLLLFSILFVRGVIRKKC